MKNELKSKENIKNNNYLKTEKTKKIKEEQI